ncbi:MAG: hypothetical protein HY608_05920, partial [Planctomycetes bacterium]|nr:hypothetical protein [Planctomycetota bacterium]
RGEEHTDPHDRTHRDSGNRGGRDHEDPPPAQPPRREGRLRRFERGVSENRRGNTDRSGARQPGTVAGEVFDAILTDSCNDMCGVLILEGLTAPWWGPAEALEDNPGQPKGLSWRPHPAPGRGYGEPQNGHLVAGTVGASYQRVSSTIEAHRVEARVRTAWRLGGDFAYTEFDEDLGDSRDVLRMRAGHLTYDFARNDWWTFTSGLGWKTLKGQEINEGIDFTYRAECYPVRPWVFDFTFEAASVSGDLLGEVSLGGGVVLKNLQVRAGYRTLFSDGTDLSGPEAGLVVWY